METLSATEEQQAKEVSIWRVVQVEPTPELIEWKRGKHMTKPPPALTRTVSFHLTKASAEEEQERRGGPSGDETPGFDVMLADLHSGFVHGAFSAAEVRAQIEREFGPLTDEESARAGRTQVWTVWYEDRFHFGADRDPPVAVAHFVTREEAEAEARKRGGEGELAGYDVGVATILEALMNGAIRRTGIARSLLAKALTHESARMLEQVKAFLAREVAAARTMALSEETQLVADLGLSGREGARLIAAFFREFSVDPEGFEVTRYFAADTIGILGRTMTTRPQIDVCVDELRNAALLGRWEDDELP